MDPHSDYPIHQLARTLGLHQVFGPMPSAQMLLQDILHKASLNHRDTTFRGPSTLASLGLHFSMYTRTALLPRLQPISVDHFWGNNWESSSFSSPFLPSQENMNNHQLVLYDPSQPQLQNVESADQIAPQINWSFRRGMLEALDGKQPLRMEIK